MTDRSPGLGRSERPERSERSKRLAKGLAQAERRRRRASKRGKANLWVQVAKVSTLGWLLALPIVGGALIGHLLDRAFDSGVSWSLTLLTVGLVVAGYTVLRHGQEVQTEQESEEEDR